MKISVKPVTVGIPTAENRAKDRTAEGVGRFGSRSVSIVEKISSFFQALGKKVMSFSERLLGRSVSEPTQFKQREVANWWNNPVG